MKAFAEIVPQFLGLAPGDSRMEPFWSLAEEFDLPVGLRMGPGPPGVAYGAGPVLGTHPEFKMAAGDPMLLEEVLLRHKRLRLIVMYAGWPRLESMLPLLYAHPNVFVDTGGLQSTRSLPRTSCRQSKRRTSSVTTPHVSCGSMPVSANRADRTCNTSGSAGRLLSD